MSFILSDLHLVSHVSGNNYWQYRTTDPHATVDTAGYFTGDALNMLRLGDIVDVLVGTFNSDRTMATVTGYGRHMVKDVTGVYPAQTAVDLTDVTAGVVTDTD